MWFAPMVDIYDQTYSEGLKIKEITGSHQVVSEDEDFDYDGLYPEEEEEELEEEDVELTTLPKDVDEEL